VGWAGLAQLTGPDSAPKGLGRSRPNSSLSFLVPGQTRPRQQGWARISLAHKTSGLGQNQPGPEKETHSAGPEPTWPSNNKNQQGELFPPILLHAEQMLCMQEETQATK